MYRLAKERICNKRNLDLKHAIYRKSISCDVCDERT